MTASPAVDGAQGAGSVLSGDAWFDAFAAASRSGGSATRLDVPSRTPVTIDDTRRLRRIGLLGGVLVDCFDPESPSAVADALIAVAERTDGTTDVTADGNADGTTDGVTDARRRRWTIRIDQVAVSSGFAAALAARAPAARIVPATAVLVTELDRGREIEHYLGNNFRKQVRRALRRSVRVERVQPGDVAARLPVVAELREERDRSTNRLGPLDGTLAEPFRRLVERLAAEHQIVFAIVWEGEQVVAYNLVICDGSTWRVVDGRVRPDASLPAVGRLADQTIIEWALADPSCSRIDWGRGETSAKRRVANSSMECVHVLAASGWPAFVVSHGPKLARDRVARFRRDHPRVDVVWLPIKRRINAR